MPLGAELAITEPLTVPLFGSAAMYCTPGGLPFVIGAELCAETMVAAKPKMRAKKRIARR